MLVTHMVKANATLADRSAARSMAFEVALWGIHFNLFRCIMSLSRLPRVFYCRFGRSCQAKGTWSLSTPGFLKDLANQLQGFQME